MSGDPHLPILRHMIKSQRDFIEGKYVTRVYSGTKEMAPLIAMLRESQVGILAFGFGDAPRVPDRMNISPPQYVAPPPQAQKTPNAPSPPAAAPPVLSAPAEQPPAESRPLIDVLTWAYSALKKTTGVGNGKKGSTEVTDLSKRLAVLRAANEGNDDNNSEQEEEQNVLNDDLWEASQETSASGVSVPIKEEPNTTTTASSAPPNPQFDAVAGIIKEESDMQSILSKKISPVRPAASVAPKERVREAKAAFEGLGEVGFADRVIFEKEIYGTDETERVVGPFWGGFYLQTDNGTGLRYFSVELNNQKYILAARTNYSFDYTSNDDYSKENHSGYLVQYEQLNAETIRNTAISMYKTFAEKEGEQNMYSAIETEAKIKFYRQNRTEVSQSLFAPLGYDQKQEIFYYITWKTRKAPLDYVATKNKIFGSSVSFEKTTNNKKGPYDTFFDAALIDIVAPLRKPTNTRIRILLRCY
jgi:hypothetical protein